MRDFFLDCLTFVDGTYKRFWNVPKQPPFAAQQPRRAKRLVLTYGYVNVSLRKLFYSRVRMSVQRCKTDFEILTPTVFPAESIKNQGGYSYWWW